MKPDCGAFASSLDPLIAAGPGMYQAALGLPLRAHRPNGATPHNDNTGVKTGGATDF